MPEGFNYKPFEPAELIVRGGETPVSQEGLKDETLGFIADSSLAYISAEAQSKAREALIRYEDKRKKLCEQDCKEYRPFHTDFTKDSDSWEVTTAETDEVYKRAVIGLTAENPDADKSEIELVARGIADEYMMTQATLSNIRRRFQGTTKLE